MCQERRCKEAARKSSGQTRADGKMTGEGSDAVCAVEGRRLSQVGYAEDIRRFRNEVRAEEVNPSPIRKTREGWTGECRKHKTPSDERTKEVEEEPAGSRWQASTKEMIKAQGAGHG